MSPLPPFDIRAPLPGPGETLLLEASAGTGKTWTIGALVARYVAAGRPLSSMLVITFGRAASQELRERVRDQLRRVHAALTVPLDPGTVVGVGTQDGMDGDPVVALLRDGTPEEVALRARRLRAALTEFDAATIATTHQFCQVVLRGLGIAGDSDPRARLVEDLTDLREEVVDDLYLRGFAGFDREPAFSRAEAGAVAACVLDNPHAALDPDTLPEGHRQARLLRFAHLVREETARRKRRQGVLGFDDLLGEVAAALATEDGPARARMRDRWGIVLVDEFQDTDPVQWEIIRRAFVGHGTVILIGDPKQAIYGFRGGDIDTYLLAAAAADRRLTLATNHRSDAPLVACLDRLLRGAQLGSPDIVVHEITAELQRSRLAAPGAGGAPVPDLVAPLRLRFVPRELLADSQDRNVPIGRVRALVARDCAAQVARALSGGLTFDGTAVRAGDIAVLAHTRVQLDHVRQALRDAGIASVIVSAESVFATPAATDWLTLLEAIAQSHRPERVRAAALTPFLGRTVAEVAALDDAGVEDLSRTLRGWADLLTRRGVAAVLAAANAAGMPARLLRHTGGERRLTDLRHIGEILHQRCVDQGDGLASLTAWLRERATSRVSDEAVRRLDSDADAVHLATIHASKGLQYPIVMLPFVADRWRPQELGDLHFHGADGRRCLDIGIRDAGRADRETRHRAEDDGESLRLLYVALTRAQSQVVTWWFPATRNTPAAALHRVLFGRGPGGADVPAQAAVPGDADARGLLRRWEEHGAVALEVVQEPEPEPLPAPRPGGALSARSWGRSIDEAWLRTSYTRLTRPLEAQLHAAPGKDLVGSEPEIDAAPAADEEGLIGVGLESPGVGAVPSPMADLPVGASFGSLVHEVLEFADPQAKDLVAELRDRVEAGRRRWGFTTGLDADALARALAAVCRTPLGPLLPPGTTLAGIGASDRLCELAFELPLAGGDAAHEGVGSELGALAGLLRTHLPDGDPVRGLADVLDDPAVGGQALRGYLTGSIDVLLRVAGRHYVVDYKTNWLGPPTGPLTTAHYGPDALRGAMSTSSYPLQALLYAVVLHRFLRWRLPGYDPARHLGGVLYLYVRGMAGPETPVSDGHPSGVFSWQAPVPLVLAVSDLLDGPETGDAAGLSDPPGLGGPAGGRPR